MLRVLTNSQRFLCSVWKRSLSSTPSVPSQEIPEENVASEPDPVSDGDQNAITRTTEKYSLDAISRLKLDQYPFYVEREWWKKGKRMTFWATWRQLRDVRRRELIQETGADRMRLKALKWNTVLPQAVRDDAADQLSKMSKYAIPRLVLNMCMFTGRQRGKIKPYRLNRHLFRKLADHSKLSGVQRAMW
ncbi:ribosomal protein S14p/S29e [Necator americanus]|uniref:Ribosomal protein S14p/S29e n=1 Tax=Necator americanus TaxID=51031 RepID=W2T6L1_NECAM|nr:ribosomal protein S14p/S29e [Necator americanus]ETN77254.1 ribosomal protein S14p/S29e [Necator americanus]